MSQDCLCLDLGTETGWALASPHGTGVYAHGHQSFRPGRWEGGGMRFLRFRRWLDELNVASPFVEVAYEEVRQHVATDAAHVYGGLLATLTAWCEEHRFAYQGVPVGTIKRAITGKGNANKQAVLNAVRSKGFSTVTSQDEADAIALALTWLEGLRRAQVREAVA